MASNVQQSVGMIAVTRAQLPTADDDDEEVKLSWTIDNWSQLLHLQAHPDTFSFELDSLPVSNAQLGIEGPGDWFLNMRGSGSRLRDGVICVGVQYDGRNRFQLQSQLVDVDVRVACKPKLGSQFGAWKSVGGKRLSGSTLQWQYVKGVVPDDYPLGFLTAQTVVVELTLCFLQRGFLIAYQSAPPAQPVEHDVSSCVSQGDLQILQTLRQSYIDAQLTDFVLVVPNGQEIPVHRLVLVAHSAVFRAMFEHDTEEKQTGSCTIKDTAYDVLKVLINGMYGVLENEQLAPLVEDVFIAADKYEVASMMGRCAGVMSNSISVENAMQRFVMAKKWHTELTEMAEQVVVFVRDNWAEFVAGGGVLRLTDREETRAVHQEFLTRVHPAKKKRTAVEAEL